MKDPNYTDEEWLVSIFYMVFSGKMPPLLKEARAQGPSISSWPSAYSIPDVPFHVGFVL
jgi:hypothetical protein